MTSAAIALRPGTLGEIADVVMGQSPIGTSYNRDGHGAPLINGPTEFTARYPVPKQWTTAPVRFCKTGDVLICVRGSSTGRTNIADTVYCIGRGVAAVRASRGNDQAFVQYALAAVVADLLKLQTGSTFPSIDSRVIRGGAVLIPEPREQRRIGAALLDADVAVVALERLIAKKQAIKQGMMQQLLTGKIRLSGFSGERGTTRLGDHFDITSSKRVFQREWRTAGVPFYRARELAVLGESGSVDKELFIDRELYEKYKRLHGAPRPGDFLVTAVGTLGKTYVVKEGDEFYFKDGNIIWLKASQSIDSHFLKFLFETPFVQDQVHGESSGTTVGTYTITNAKRTIIPLITLGEQRAIANILSTLDVELRVVAKRLAKARAVKQGMMQQLLRGRTRLPVQEAAS